MSVPSVDAFKGLISKAGGLARSNLFLVQLPNIQIDGEVFATYDYNILCKSSQLPGRQIMSTPRDMGLERTLVANNYDINDVNLTFRVMNDYKIKKYFDTWQSLAISQQGDWKSVGYFKHYAKDVTIKQLRKGLSYNIYKNNLDFMDDIPSNIKNRLPTIGPIDLSQGEIDLSIITPQYVSYEVVLRNAYPTSIVAIELSDDDANAIIELHVSLSYTNWYTESKGALSKIGDVLAKFGIF
jgi:hypothetical protein